MIKFSEQMNNLFPNMVVTKRGKEIGVGPPLAWKQAVSLYGKVGWLVVGLVQLSHEGPGTIGGMHSVGVIWHGKD